jgi:hypothetical protein
MTLPNERTRAILNTREFLLSLLDPKKTPRVPKEIRRQAYWCLRHFPGDWDIREAARKAPKVFEMLEEEDGQ